MFPILVISEGVYSEMMPVTWSLLRVKSSTEQTRKVEPNVKVAERNLGNKGKI